MYQPKTLTNAVANFIDPQALRCLVSIATYHLHGGWKTPKYATG